MDEMRRCVIESLLGPLTLVVDGPSLVGLYFDDHRVKKERALQGEMVDAGADPVLAEATAQVRAYLAGGRTSFELPLAPSGGSALDRRVWDELGRTGLGETVTYGQVARELGNPRMAQAVGGAVGRNPICLVLPCHRVVGASGTLTGYAGGPWRKRWLLDHEAWLAGRSALAPGPPVRP
ncbi:methylated-DNA--[protein]-cysteine S-methyltransferase [Luteococcus sp.]|uniref:methylated-DNA--[protein]-cysteine S-methyltransferase n=1 Tax=Luteococcus sp. TaxID=1969402 RepID=UPI003735A15E